MTGQESVKEIRDDNLAGLGDDSANVPQLGAIARFEFKFILLLALLLCAVSSIPYIVGHFAPYPGSVFTGVLAFEDDANNYLAYAHQAAARAWLFHNPMTGEVHGNVFFNLEWLLIGKLAAVLHISVGSAMNGMRVLFIPIMYCAVYWLATFLIRDLVWRRAALVAAVLGGGFGWFLLALNLLHIPAEQSYFYDLKTGLFPYFWTLKAPHHLIAGTFATLSLCMYLRAERRPRVGSYAAAGLLFLLTGACRPYDMVYLLAATGVYWVVSSWRSGKLDRQALLRLVPSGMCLPLLGYYYWIFRIHPVFRWWTLPGQAPPAPWVLAFSFGLAFPFLLLSVWKLRGERLRQADVFMICCVITACALVYSHRLLPFTFQYATDILVPLVMVVFLGLEKPFVQWNAHSRWACIALVALLVVNSLTAVALTAQTARLAWRGNSRLDRGLAESYTWLNRHSRADEVVLADIANSNRIPQYTHNRVYCGYVSAVRYEEKVKAVDQFLAPGTSEEFRVNLLQQNSVRYVLLTQEEAGQLPMLREIQFLHPVFANHAAVIYLVEK